MLRQLNHMTGVAARMERKEHNNKFTDIMEYDPEKDSWYLPGLWYGNPPMAMVNEGCIMDFLELTRSLWNAVKYENFIFSFHNSLEADAYNMLCVKFNKSHGGEKLRQSYQRYQNLTCKISFKAEGINMLNTEERNILQKLEEYKDNFVNSAKILPKDTENSLKSQLEMAVESNQNMAKLDHLKKTQSATMEKQVIKLLDACRGKDTEMSDEQLEVEFEVPQ
ncbi:unnamed protein product [Coregonus sp. 'balchen']|nr:unnamed protein product [Coregonus sp. 'balchen']